jgi:hypothetical protein
VPDTTEEQLFREKYGTQLRNLKDFRELEEERRQVWRQQLRTLGRRGEEIKREEIEQEIFRRQRNASSAW